MSTEKRATTDKVYSFLRSVGAQASKLGVQFTVYSLKV